MLRSLSDIWNGRELLNLSQNWSNSWRRQEGEDSSLTSARSCSPGLVRWTSPNAILRYSNSRHSNKLQQRRPLKKKRHQQWLLNKLKECFSALSLSWKSSSTTHYKFTVYLCRWKGSKNIRTKGHRISFVRAFTNKFWLRINTFFWRFYIEN